MIPVFVAVKKNIRNVVCINLNHEKLQKIPLEHTWKHDALNFTN